MIQKNRQKRALAIHDISCIGRCSITVALPILSAAGINTGVLPTAVLSTHTGGSSGYTYRDLTEDLAPIAAHWKSLGLSFDALYSGFLGSYQQIDRIAELFRAFRTKDNLILVDPVMGDNGAFYAVYSERMAQEMRKLCAMADLIVPNCTEAAFLLDRPYHVPCTEAETRELLLALTELGAPCVVLTGVSLQAGRLGAACYDKRIDRFVYTDAPYVEGFFHGTGDLFSSALLAALLNDFSLEKALSVAVRYTHRCIEYTVEEGQEARFGPCFERAMPFLLELLQK